MIATELGEKIVLCRKAKGWSQEDLEEFSGVSKTQISRLERGLATPLMDTFDKLEKALGLPQNDLLREVVLSQKEEEMYREIDKAIYTAEFSLSQLSKLKMIIELIGEISK